MKTNAERSREFLEGISIPVSYRALEHDYTGLSSLLDLPAGDFEFCHKCVGDGMRKGYVMLDWEETELTHFVHQCRVAALVQEYFPEDVWSKRLALFHDCKEEALEGKEYRYRELWEELPFWIDILTEKDPSLSEMQEVWDKLPKWDWDVRGVTKYRNYIALLHKYWDIVGSVELGDRYDGVSFAYLQASKYQVRMPYKAIEAFARIYATVSVSDHVLAEYTRQACRDAMPEFGVKEEDVISFSQYFLS